MKLNNKIIAMRERKYALTLKNVEIEGGEEDGKNVLLIYQLDTGDETFFTDNPPEVSFIKVMALAFDLSDEIRGITKNASPAKKIFLEALKIPISEADKTALHRMKNLDDKTLWRKFMSQEDDRIYPAAVMLVRYWLYKIPQRIKQEEGEALSHLDSPEDLFRFFSRQDPKDLN